MSRLSIKFDDEDADEIIDRTENEKVCSLCLRLKNRDGFGIDKQYYITVRGVRKIYIYNKKVCNKCYAELANCNYRRKRNGI